MNVKVNIDVESVRRAMKRDLENLSKALDTILQAWKNGDHNVK